MKPITYYTIIIGRNFSMVKYAVGPEYAVSTFPGMFDDPGEASQEFKKVAQGKLEHLTEGMFQRKVGDLASRYSRDKVKLADWNSGKAVQI